MLEPATEKLNTRWRVSCCGGCSANGHLEANNIRYAQFVEQRCDAVAAFRARGDAEDRLAHGAALTRDQLVAYVLDQLADTQH
jgi:hypothetical protein